MGDGVGKAAADAALGRLLTALAARDYHFVTPTPATHARVVSRPFDAAGDPLRALFGWSRAVPRAAVDGELVRLLAAAGGLAPAGPGLIASRYRVASEGGRLFLHSAYPAIQQDAVFFGPDSYRFAAWLRRRLAERPGPVSRLAEIGAGTGVGALTAHAIYPGAGVVMTDINPAALRLAGVHAARAGVAADLRLTACLTDVDGPFDVILANPPYMIDPARRAYRDGGAVWGAQSALDWAAQALPLLAPGGGFFLYGGAPVVDGRDVLRARLSALAETAGARMRYEEIDPDVWGEELDGDAYAEVERIAVIGAEFSRS